MKQQQIQSQSSKNESSTKKDHHKTEAKNKQKNTITFVYIVDAEIHAESKGVKSIKALLIDRKLQQVYTASISQKQSPLQLTLAMMIGTYIPIDHPSVRNVSTLAYDEMKPAQRKILKSAIRDIVMANEDVFINVYNNGRSLTVKLHSLSLLPKFGTKRIFVITDAKRYKPFNTFKETEQRAPLVKDPASFIVERILVEIENPEEKFKILPLSGITPRLTDAKTEVEQKKQEKQGHTAVTLPVTTLKNEKNKVT